MRSVDQIAPSEIEPIPRDRFGHGDAAVLLGLSHRNEDLLALIDLQGMFGDAGEELDLTAGMGFFWRGPLPAPAQYESRDIVRQPYPSRITTETAPKMSASDVEDLAAWAWESPPTDDQPWLTLESTTSDASRRRTLTNQKRSQRPEPTIFIVGNGQGG